MTPEEVVALLCLIATQQATINRLTQENRLLRDAINRVPAEPS